jgi:hypothetical protein
MKTPVENAREAFLLDRSDANRAALSAACEAERAAKGQCKHGVAGYCGACAHQARPPVDPDVARAQALALAREQGPVDHAAQYEDVGGALTPSGHIPQTGRRARRAR